MKHFVQLSDLTAQDIKEIFALADSLAAGGHQNALRGKTVVMFFPESSIRTRVTFEKGIYKLGGQSILFSPETLDKREALDDVFGYLNNWSDLVVVRHSDIGIIEEIARHSAVPVVNAMTKVNHPCEILSDLYALSKIRKDFTKDKFLFVGTRGNIGLTWKEASEIFGFSLEQCCPKGYEVEGLKTCDNISEAIVGKDLICTDSLPGDAVEAFKNCQVTEAALKLANPGALLNPCPPFFRGEEVSSDAISSDHFVGYEFKQALLSVQQAIMLFLLGLK